MSPYRVATAKKRFIQIGDILDDGTNVRLRVTEVRGGGMGVVAIGNDERHDNRMMVLKTYNPYDENDQLYPKEALDRYRRVFTRHEAEIWCGLWPHPNIMRAVSLVTITCRSALEPGHVFAGQPFIYLDYAEGIAISDTSQRIHTLAQMLSLWRGVGQTPDRALALRWAQELAAALTYLHEPDNDPATGMARPDPIAHLDLKPANLLFHAGQLCVTDLGLARIAAETLAATTSRAPRAGQTMLGGGTVGYAAPEQVEYLLGLPATVDYRADLFAFGIILYELYTGHHPAQDIAAPRVPGDPPDHALIYRRQLPDLAAVVPDLPDAIETIYQICTRRQPAQRTLTARQIAALLATVAGDAAYTPEIDERTPAACGEIWANWAKVYSDIGLPAEALDAYARATELNPAEALPWNGRGNALSDLGRPAEALDAFARATDLDPASALPWYGRGNALSDLGRPTEALDAYARAIQAAEHAIAIASDDPRSWNRLGYIHFAQHHFNEALAAIDHAIALSPKEAAWWDSRAEIACGAERWHEALVAAQQALSLDASLQACWEYTIEALTHLGRADEAEQVRRAHPRP